ncbi:MAG: S9 family peptidase [Erythrobacter sp.]|jgi:dipeptidyl aminopeptidase/acylaminoacyl peptidase|nr:S9 family peptidase [Erythrobacter sp.]
MHTMFLKSLAGASVFAFASATLGFAPASAQNQAERAAIPERTVPGLDKPAMRAEDLILMPRLVAPQVTGDGSFAIYAVTYTDPETYVRSLQHFRLALDQPSALPAQLDLGLDARSVVPGGDGALYFLSDEHIDPEADSRARLWRAAMGPDGQVGAPSLVADMDGAEITGFKLSPDAGRVALFGEIARDCPRFGCAVAEDTLGTGRLYDGDAGFYRHWDTWMRAGVFNRVFVFDIVDGKVSGDGVPLDGGDAAGAVTGHVPTRPFGGTDDIAWMPDSSGVFFTMRESNRDEPASTDLDIYYSDLSLSAPVVVTGANEAYDSTPAVSPDGTLLAYLAMERPGYESDRRTVMLRDIANGTTRAITAETDLSFDSLAWDPTGRILYATAADRLDTPVFRINPQSGEVEQLNLIAGTEAHIANVIPLAEGRMLFTRDSIGAPAELYHLTRAGAKGEPITDIATSRVGAMASTRTSRFTFAGAEGATVYGQITRLEKQTGPIPAILYIHGGPQGSFNDAWSSRWNPRTLASQGYAVISVDFHGSSGYGQDFMDAINRDWGGKPLEDLQKGLAAALAEDQQIDGSRACAMGASYGGYMVNWIAGNWNDRFDCLVQHDGLFDLRSFYYSTEELWFPRWDFGGSYTQARETYERWNPINFVDNWQTPMLVIAGEQDFRVPYTQGLQSFTALQEREVPAQLLVFPEENHWVLGAENSLQWHRTVFAWLDRWLYPDTEGEQ